MPKVNWRELDKLIHDCKDTLSVAYFIEKQCKDTVKFSRKMRKRVGKHLEALNTIILDQEDDEGKTIQTVLKEEKK